MYQLADVTLLFAVRIESSHRLRNLQLNTQYLLRHLCTHILIGEEGPPYHVSGEGIFMGQGVAVVRLPVSHPNLFWKTRATNQLLQAASTPYAATLDSDVLFFPWQYADAYQLLKANMADAVYPFDRPTKRIARRLHARVAQTCDLSSFTQLPDSNSEVATGGCLFFDVARFRRYGLENERIIGWGPEDNERDVRLRRLGARLRRVSGPLFHLEHRRGLISRVTHELTDTNDKECARIASLNSTDLAAEILTWPWIRPALSEFGPR
jgi:hypothetical protein